MGKKVVIPAQLEAICEALDKFLAQDHDRERLDVADWPAALRQCAEAALQEGRSGEPAGPLVELYLQRILAAYLRKAHQECHTERTQLALWLPGLIIWAEYVGPTAIEARLRQPRPDWRNAVAQLQRVEFLAASPLGSLQDVPTRTALQKAIRQRAKELVGERVTNKDSFYALRKAGIVVLAQAVVAAAAGKLTPLETATVPPAGVPWQAPGLPRTYVERTELAALREWLLMANASGPRALVLSGVAGAGKTTLAVALLHDADVRATFADIILWANAQKEDVLVQLGQQAKLSGRDGDLAAAWQRWAGDPTRRALVILDDVVDGDLLEAVAGESGPGLTFLATTQFGDDVRLALQRLWGARANVTLQQLIHLSQPDAHSLFAWVLGRSLTAGEREWVAEIGAQLGWHTGALVFAAFQVNVNGWESVLAVLREGRLPAERQLERMVQRQWERLGAGRRARFAALIPPGRDGGPFGVLYAMAVWAQSGPTLAEADLAAFERIGFLERLQVPAGGAHSCYLRAPLWRAAPVVERALRQLVALERWSPSDRLMVASRLQGHIRRAWPAPWQFQVLMTLWWLVWGGVKLGLDAWEAVLGLVRRGGRGEPSALARQLRWGVPGTAREHLEAYWRGWGVEPPQEAALLHELSAQEGRLLLRASLAVILVAVVGGLLGLLVPPVRHYSWAWGLALSGLIYWLLRPGVWRTWLAYLYEVDTWDLRLIVRLCRRLGMREPARVELDDRPGFAG